MNILAGYEIGTGNPVSTPAAHMAIPAQKLGNGTVWYIPMKVKPSYRGDASRAHVLYFDTKTQQLAGPFSPTVLPQ
jgi:hypothetical protein